MMLGICTYVHIYTGCTGWLEYVQAGLGQDRVREKTCRRLGQGRVGQ